MYMSTTLLSVVYIGKVRMSEPCGYILDAQSGVLVFAHIVVLLLFNSLNMYLLAGKHVVNELVQFVPVLVDGLNDEDLLVCREFRPGNLNLLLPVLLNPNLGHGVASVRLLAASAPHVDVPPILRRVGGKYREDEVEEYHQFAHVAVVYVRKYGAKIANISLINSIPLEKLTKRHEKGREVAPTSSASASRPAFLR